MYKVLIVDDEILARVGIKSLIRWHDHGFEIVGECENGKKAYSLSREVLPDIIITDIKMPVMGGIDLIRALKNEGSNVKFVVLSSYDDFEYVKEAMRLGAEDYILKLQMEPDSLLKVLADVCRKIEQEEKERSKNTRIEKHINENIPILKEKFLKDLLFGTEINEHALEEKFQVYGITLNSKNLACMIIRIDNMESNDNYPKHELHMRKFSISNILEDILMNYGGGYTCYTGPHLYAIIWSAENGANESYIYRSIDRMTKDIQEFLKDSMNLTTSIGVSNIHQGYLNISNAHREALEAINKNFVYPAGSIVKYSEIKNILSDKNITIPLEMELNDLENSLKACDLESIGEAFDHLKQKLTELGNVSKKNLNGICHILIFIVNVFIQDNDVSPKDIWHEEESPYSQVEKLIVLNDFINWITGLERDIGVVLDENRYNKAIILKAKKFIKKHFCEDISLKMVSEHLGLSPGYFSRFFSKETGESFVDYVTCLRVHYAKELLRTTKYKVYEVSELVGYENQHYFSRIFKKITGVSPVDYKANTVNQNE